MYLSETGVNWSTSFSFDSNIFNLFKRLLDFFLTNPRLAFSGFMLLVVFDFAPPDVPFGSSTFSSKVTVMFGAIFLNKNQTSMWIKKWRWLAKKRVKDVRLSLMPKGDSLEVKKSWDNDFKWNVWKTLEKVTFSALNRVPSEHNSIPSFCSKWKLYR